MSLFHDILISSMMSIAHEECCEYQVVTFCSLLLLGFISQAAKLGAQGASACHLFSMEELKEATNNFDSSTFMGEGSVGKVLLKNSNVLWKFSA